MELGMIGLGKTGAFMTERLVRGGHRVVGFDRDPAAVKNVGTRSCCLILENGSAKAPACGLADGPRRRACGPTIDLTTYIFCAGDTIIDGGNGYKIRFCRASLLRRSLISLTAVHQRRRLGPHGRLLVGGDADVVKRLSPIFRRSPRAPR